MRAFAGAVALAAVSAVLFGLSFPPTGWRHLEWFVLAPFLLALRKGGIRQALLVSWLWCVVGASVAGDWFPRAVARYFDQPMPVALALFAALFTFMAAPYFMAFTVVYRGLARRFRLLLPFLTAAAWVGAELGRGRLMTGTAVSIGNPWGLVGYAQVDTLPLVQIASMTGIYGVSFVVVCVNAAVAEAWVALKEPGRRLGTAASLVAASCLPALAALGFGLSVLRDAPPSGEEPDAIPVTLIQGNIQSDARWRSDYYGKNLDTYLRLTMDAAANSTPRIAFWPESAMTFFLEDEPLYRAAIARVLASHDLELVAGGPRTVELPSRLFFNTTFVMQDDGAISASYDKEHLVPFAEYFPLGIDVLRRHFGRVRYFEHGTTTAPLETRAGLAGVVVCNESMLPEVAGQRVAAGAEYLLNPSNDSWISDPKYSEEQLDISTVRAIEQRRYLVRASTAGPSAVIDPYGRVQVRGKTEAQEVLHGRIRPSNERTLYGRFGDLFASSCLAISLLALFARRLTGSDTRAALP